MDYRWVCRVILLYNQVPLLLSPFSPLPPLSVPFATPFTSRHQMGWSNELSISLPFWEIGWFGHQGFEPWSSQMHDLKIDTCGFLARQTLIIIRIGQGLVGSVWGYCYWVGHGADSLVSHWGSTMSVHCHKLVPILIWPYMLLERKTANNKHHIPPP